MVDYNIHAIIVPMDKFCCSESDNYCRSQGSQMGSLFTTAIAHPAAVLIPWKLAKRKESYWTVPT